MHGCIALDPRSITSKLDLRLSVAVERYKEPHQHLYRTVLRFPSRPCLTRITRLQKANSIPPFLRPVHAAQLYCPSKRWTSELTLRAVCKRKGTKTTNGNSTPVTLTIGLLLGNGHRLQLFVNEFLIGHWNILTLWTKLSLYAAVPIFATAMIAPALSEIAKQFHIHNSTVTSLILSVPLLTHIFGVRQLVSLLSIRFWSSIFSPSWFLCQRCMDEYG